MPTWCLFVWCVDASPWNSCIKASHFKLETSNHHEYVSIGLDTIQPPHLHCLPSDRNNHHTFTRLLAIAVGMRRHPICASAAPSVHAPCSPGQIKKLCMNPIAPFSTTTRDRTARPPPCTSTFIVDNVMMLNKVRSLKKCLHSHIFLSRLLLIHSLACPWTSSAIKASF